MRLTMNIEHTPGFVEGLPTTSVGEVEQALSDWFGAEVVLTSSGRAAILLYLTALGLDRYTNRIAVPRMMSSCVLDAVIRRGFPIDAEGAPRADATILYHQYGIPQPGGTSDNMIEDVCHSFFSTTRSGSRDWRGDVAVFSLPKFFRLTGMGGGLILVRGTFAGCLRQMRDEASQDSVADNQLRVLHSGNLAQPAIELVYLSRLLNPRLFDHETGGMPATLPAIRRVGEKRQSIMEQLLDVLGQDALPAGWPGLLRRVLPFALPVFGDIPRLKRLDAMLGEIGVKAGIYKIDVARNMASPRYQSAVLVPCHHEISASTLGGMARLLEKYR